MKYIQINQEKTTKITTKFVVLWKDQGLFIGERTNTFLTHQDA